MVVEIKLKIKKIFPVSASFLFLFCSLHRQEDVSELRWGKKETKMESDI